MREIVEMDIEELIDSTWTMEHPQDFSQIGNQIDWEALSEDIDFVGEHPYMNNLRHAVFTRYDLLEQ